MKQVSSLFLLGTLSCLMGGYGFFGRAAFAADPPDEGPTEDFLDTPIDNGAADRQDQDPSVERFLQEEEFPRYDGSGATAGPPESNDPSANPIFLQIEGYADFGFFIPTGDGTGVRQDPGGQGSQDFGGRFAWSFFGDLLSTAVNSRGEAADLGDLPGVQRFDSINSQGAAGFVLNEVNLRLRSHPAERVSLLASINFVPRTGRDFSLGDFVEVELAQLEWQPFAQHPTSIFVGKIEPTVGVEYRDRRSDRRFGVTPSLLARYTTGTQLGVKVRSLLFERLLILTAAFTNGSATTEQFHFYDEVDSNSGKTVSGRVAVNIPLQPLLAGRLELGVSGAYGPQDVARDVRDGQWLAAADAFYDGVEFFLRAEVLRGGSPGRAVDGAYGLDLRFAGYLEAGWRINALVGVYGRLDLRDALVTLGDDRAYLSRTWRGTLGVRGTINPFLAIKAEYLHNGEFGELPTIPNDVLTSSLVVTWSPTFGSY